MEVYIEYVILDNLIINFILLGVVNKICNLGVKQRNIFFASIIGTIFVILMPLIKMLDYLIMAYRLITALCMVLVLQKPKSFKKTFSTYLCLVTVTLLFGGALIMTLSLFDITYTSSGLIFLSFELPISLFIFPIWIYSKIFMKLYNYILDRMRTSKYYYDTTIVCFGHKHNLRAFLDTGNNLYDIDGRPIIVMELKTFCSIFPDFPIHKLLMHNIQDSTLNNPHFVNVSTVNSNDKMFVFEVDSIIVRKNKESSEFSKVCIGVSHKNFEEYNLILHRNFC